MPEPQEGKAREEFEKLEKDVHEHEQTEREEIKKKEEGIEKDARQKGADLEKDLKERFGHHEEEQPQAQPQAPKQDQPDKP